MADVLNRATRQFLRSVHTPAYPAEAWIRNPDLSAVEGVPAKYWKISGDTVSAMSQAERDAADAAEAAAAATAAKTGAKAEFDAQPVLRALASVLRDEINILRNAAGLQPRTAAQVRTAIRDAIDAQNGT